MPSGNKRFQFSISSRISLLFSATFASGLLIAFVVTYFQIQKSLEESNRTVMTAKLQETSTILSTEGVDVLRGFLAEEKNRIVNAPFLIRVLTVDGDALFTKPSVQQETFDFDSLSRKELHPEQILGWHALSAVNDEGKFDLLTEKVRDNLYIQVGKSSEDRDEILERIVSVFAVTGGVIALLSILLGIWYAKKSLSPLRNLRSTMLEIERGDLGRRVVVGEAQDELQDMAQTFNRMIARIEKLIHMMRESLDNVAHDIRTPLTRIRAVAEDALTSSTSDSLRDALADCAESSENISELVDQLMSISEAEAGTLALRYETNYVRELLTDVVEIYEFVALEKFIEVTLLPFDKKLLWMMDRKRIKQVVANLLDNAIKFSPPNKIVVINAEVRDDKLVISVEDRGPGVADDELGRIWDRLYRGDKSRSTKGLGLGLSIVKSITLAHGGNVQVIKVSEGGLRFSVTIPKLS